MTFRCVKCNVELGFSNWGDVRDISGKACCCCRFCKDIVIEELKQKRFIENYKGEDIFVFEGRYYPYWGCPYSYYNIEDCRARIDMKNVAVVPTELLNRLRQGKSLL